MFDHASQHLCILDLVLLLELLHRICPKVVFFVDPNIKMLMVLKELVTCLCNCVSY